MGAVRDFTYTGQEISMDRTAEFVGLLTQHQPGIYALIRSLVPHRADAEDILQETSQVLWKKFDSFESGTNFLAWARQVARFEVQHFLRQRQADRLCFSEPLVEALADEGLQSDERASETSAALQSCLTKLDRTDRELLTNRYEENTTLQQLAEQSRASVQTLYSRLKRIRRRLFDCIHRTLAAGGTA